MVPQISNSLRTTGLCVLLVLMEVSCDTTRDPLRDAYRQVKMDLLSHPYAVDKIPPKVNMLDHIDLWLSFIPQQNFRAVYGVILQSVTIFVINFGFVLFFSTLDPDVEVLFLYLVTVLFVCQVLFLYLVTVLFVCQVLILYLVTVLFVCQVLSLYLVTVLFVCQVLFLYLVTVLFACQVLFLYLVTVLFACQVLFLYLVTVLFVCQVLILYLVTVLFVCQVLFLYLVTVLFVCQVLFLYLVTVLFVCQVLILYLVTVLFVCQVLILYLVTVLFVCQVLILYLVTVLFVCQVLMLNLVTGLFVCQALMLNLVTVLFVRQALMLNLVTVLFVCQVLFVNEVEMTVTISATLALGWSEPAFAWDLVTSNITAVSVSIHDIWAPVLANPLSTNSDDITIEMPPSVKILHTGEIQLVKKVTVTVHCAFDMEWFPFDEQRCLFPFMPYNADSANVNTRSNQQAHLTIGPGDEETDADWTWLAVVPIDSLYTNDINAQKNFTFTTFQ
ncbi:hypothetical protein RRG08_007411, partial [Elysia crispata]